MLKALPVWISKSTTPSKDRSGRLLAYRVQDRIRLDAEQSMGLLFVDFASILSMTPIYLTCRGV